MILAAEVVVGTSPCVGSKTKASKSSGSDSPKRKKKVHICVAAIVELTKIEDPEHLEKVNALNQHVPFTRDQSDRTMFKTGTIESPQEMVNRLSDAYNQSSIAPSEDILRHSEQRAGGRRIFEHRYSRPP